MAKSLVLTITEQFLQIDAIPTGYHIEKVYSDATSKKFVMAINAETQEREPVNFNDLITINGLPLFFKDNSVWRASNA